jgi:hypothetical protein
VEPNGPKHVSLTEVVDTRTRRPAHRGSGRHRGVVAVPARQAGRPLPLTAFDNRGVGRTAMPEGSVSAEMMAAVAGSWGRWRFPRPTWPGSPGAASSPRSWPCATRSWSAAWCCRRPRTCSATWTPSSATTPPTACRRSPPRLRPGRRPRLDRAVTEGISGARFEVMEEAHQPFQEIPDQWNARVDAFWRQDRDAGLSPPGGIATGHWPPLGCQERGAATGDDARRLTGAGHRACPVRGPVRQAGGRTSCAAIPPSGSQERTVRSAVRSRVLCGR